MKIAVLDDWNDDLPSLPCFARLARHDVRVWNDHAATDVLAERLQSVEALVLFRERSPVPRELIEALPALRVIALRGTCNHVNLEACAAHGVAVVAAPSEGSAPHATAELTLGLVIAAARSIPQHDRGLRAGDWQSGAVLPGLTLAGRRLGIWSFGRIGRAVAGYGRALGMEVVTHGGEASMDRAAAEGFAVEASREAFFETSDVVSLHLRSVPATRGIVTRALLARMKRDAIFVNTSRAALVEEGALAAALRAGRPGRAAVDVFEDEPMTDADHPLLALPNVVATPHLGFVTREELEAQFAAVFDLVNAFAEGRVGGPDRS